MVYWGMIFCVIIAKVGFSGFPGNAELVLANAVLYSVKSHVYIFGPFFLDCGVHYAVGG